MKVMRIRWNPGIKKETLDRICGRFGIEYHPTLNGINEYPRPAEDVDLFEKTAAHGHYSIIQVKES